MKEIIIVSVLCIGAFFDIKYRKIPNMVTIPFLISGFVMSILNGGISSLLTILLNILITIIIFGHGFLMRYIGGGDIKLLLAIACWTELEVFTIFVILTLLTGAVFAIYNIFKEYKVGQMISGIRNINMYSISENMKLRNGKKIAYGVCMFIGYIITIWIK